MELFLAPRAGIWCRNASGWDSFRAALQSAAGPAAPLAEPVPGLLPAREGRRAPLHVRLAIEAGTQACAENAALMGDVATVFTSAMGDTEITDYMCRTLAGPAPMLSPTRFHNSVHNAASGYWSIGATNRQPAVAVAAGEHSWSTGLLEACTMAATTGGRVLFVAHDVGAPVPLQAVTANRQPFAMGLLISGRREGPSWRPATVTWRAASTPWPAPATPWLRQLAAENASARGVALLESLAAGPPFLREFPLGRGCSLALECA